MKKEPPLPVEPAPPIECTSSRTVPIVDLTATTVLGLAGWGGGFMLMFLASEGMEQPEAGWLLGAAAACAVASTVLIFSTIYGFEHAKACDDLKTLQADCVAGNQEACSRLRGERFAPPAVPATSQGQAWLEEATRLSAARLAAPKSPGPFGIQTSVSR
jgi:hypothetical protein